MQHRENGLRTWAKQLEEEAARIQERYISKGEREGEKEDGNEEGGGGREGEVWYRGLCGINSHQLDCYV